MFGKLLSSISSLLIFKRFFKTFNFILSKKLFDRKIYNIVSENLTVNQIITKINKNNKTKIKLVNVKIMNQLSYKVDSTKIRKID